MFKINKVKDLEIEDDEEIFLRFLRFKTQKQDNTGIKKPMSALASKIPKRRNLFPVTTKSSLATTT